MLSVLKYPKEKIEGGASGPTPPPPPQPLPPTKTPIDKKRGTGSKTEIVGKAMLMIYRQEGTVCVILTLLKPILPPEKGRTDTLQ